MPIVTDNHVRIYQTTITQVRQALGRTVTIYLEPTEVDCEWCFFPDTEVYTANGLKPIQDIKIGEKVLTKSGKFNRVLKLFSRSYEGEYITITPYTSGGSIKCTPNHKFYVIRDDKEIEVEASSLLSSDYIRTNSIKIENTDIVLPQSSYRQKKDGPKVASISSMLQDKDFLRIIGLFIAEGGYGDRNVNFSFSSDENNLIQFVHSFFTKYGFKPKISDRKKYGEHCTQVIINSVVLRKWFEDNCGIGSENKFIPHVILNNYAIEKTLQGYIEGDGYFDSSSGKLIISTVSKKLAYQILLVLSTLGYYTSSLHVKKGWKDKNNVSHKTSYTISFKDTNDSGAYKKIVNGVKYTKIKEIQKNSVDKTTVYNLEVENEHNYTVYNIAVSNCKYDPVAKKSSGIAESGKDWTTHPDYTAGINDVVCPNCNGEGTVETQITKTALATKKDISTNDRVDNKAGIFMPATIRLSCDLNDVLVDTADKEGDTWFHRAQKVEYDGEFYEVVNPTKSGLRDLYTCRVILERTNK